MKKYLLLITVLALIVAACGGGAETTGELPLDDGSATPGASGVCAEGEPDCNDTPGGEPTDLPQSGSADEAPPAAIPVADAAAMSGPVAVAGFIVAIGDQVKLCEALAESFPPQCGGPNIPISSLDQVDPDELVAEGDVTWTDYPVTIFGELVDGTLVVTPVE